MDSNDQNLTPKLQKQLTAVHCEFFIPKKKRYCNLPPKAGHQYCTSHLQEIGGKKRVPCPFDPRHSIYEKDVEKHLQKRCPSLKAQKELESSSYYKKGINSGSNELPQLEEQTNEGGKDDPSALAEKTNNTSEPPQKKLRVPSKLSQLADEFFRAFVLKVENAFEKYVPVIPFDDQIHVKLDNVETNTKEYKHTIQEASIVGQLKKCEFLQEGNVFIDFGSGRGKLSALLNEHVGGEKILVDKKKNFQHRINKEEFRRFAMDISDLDLSGMNLSESKPVVAYSKHLCGGATDVTCRCLCNTLKYKTGENRPFDCLVVALCCHHKCNWNSYINKNFFLKDLNFSPEDFHLVTLMSSWAVERNETKESKQTPLLHAQRVHHDTLTYDNIGVNDRETLGLKCKRLIDTGRVLYLKDKGYRVSLVYYVDNKVTPENCLLVATKSND